MQAHFSLRRRNSVSFTGRDRCSRRKVQATTRCVFFSLDFRCARAFCGLGPSPPLFRERERVQKPHKDPFQVENESMKSSAICLFVSKVLIKVFNSMIDRITRANMRSEKLSAHTLILQTAISSAARGDAQVFRSRVLAFAVSNK